jgi:Zn-dependent peptidase ImmA (M78 family)
MKTTNVIGAVRAVMPARPLTLSEAFTVAELQATKLLDVLGIDQPSVPVGRLADLPKIDVRVQPRHRMPAMAGFSQWTDGRWLIVINKNCVPGRRRFTLAHEFKHVLDHNVARIVYAQLGRGDIAKHDQQVEWICQFFAACLLMPRTWVKRAWMSGIQDEEALAGLFKVSLEAMHKRLVYLGFLDDDRPVADYFRTDSVLLVEGAVA